MKLKYCLLNINNGKLNHSSGIRGYFIKFFVYSGVTFLSLFLGYCDENVDPKAPFKERYIFNLVIRGDTTYQIATLTKSYTVEGLDPYENQVDPAIKDADIRVWSKDDVYIMRDTAVARQDTSRYKTPVNFYYIKNFTPVSETPIDVRVELNNGRILTASTKIPAKMDIDSVDLLIPSKDKPNFSYVWKNNDGGTFYLYRFRFYYTFTDNSKVTWFIKEVPLTYIKSGDQYYPYFPSITKNTKVLYDNSALDSAMVQISKGVIDKSKFEIKKAEFEVLIFDKVLSDYYSSTHGYLDDYSVRIDQTDYTNINGGFGVFASYLDQKINVEFTEKYVMSFGYKYGF
jgi:hypothetical protein